MNRPDAHTLGLILSGKTTRPDLAGHDILSPDGGLQALLSAPVWTPLSDPPAPETWAQLSALQAAWTLLRGALEPPAPQPDEPELHLETLLAQVPSGTAEADVDGELLKLIAQHRPPPAPAAPELLPATLLRRWAGSSLRPTHITQAATLLNRPEWTALAAFISVEAAAAWLAEAPGAPGPARAWIAGLGSGAQERFTQLLGDHAAATRRWALLPLMTTHAACTPELDQLLAAWARACDPERPPQAHSAELTIQALEALLALPGQPAARSVWDGDPFAQARRVQMPTHTHDTWPLRALLTLMIAPGLTAQLSAGGPDETQVFETRRRTRLIRMLHDLLRCDTPWQADLRMIAARLHGRRA